MNYSTINYIFFLFIVFSLYQIISQKFRPLLLLISSYIFYSFWSVKYFILIVCVSIISYYVGHVIYKYKKIKKITMVFGVFLFLSILFIFKYNKFFEILINWLLLNRNYEKSFENIILLPIGISFYIFRIISYLVDLYRGDLKEETNFINYALYISFFPKLIAGPIDRAGDFLQQLKRNYIFVYEEAANGIRIITWGLFKKLVIADGLAVYVDKIYGNVFSYSGFVFILATLLYSIQIYSDFSGYCDIAIGSGRLFGIEMINNFNVPYFACSLKEFWGRWHISLSRWLMDYVYIPLGGSRKGKWRGRVNLLTTFLVSGLWHGGNITFIIWGCIHGIASVIEKMVILSPLKNKSNNILIKMSGWIWTFGICCFAWVFFRSASFEEAKFILLNAGTGISNIHQYLQVGFIQLGVNVYKLIQLTVALVGLFCVDGFQYAKRLNLNKIPRAARWGAYILLVIMVLIFSQKGGAEFVYLQF